MEVALWLVCLVVAVVAVTGFSRSLELPAPVILVAVGVAASYLPFVPEVRLSAEVVLVGLLPPLLYNAALTSSLVDFRTHRKPILSLSIGLVAFTTVGVAVVVHAVVPTVEWPAAFAIGAVVSPPDAVAATAVARRIGLPRRLVTILEGESLLNDATALVALNTARIAAAGSVSAWTVGLDFLWTAAVGVLAGLVVYVAVGWVRNHVTVPVMDTSVSFVTPFIAYVLAEKVHASGVLAVVTAGLLLGHRAPVLQTASSRIAERLNWQTIAYLLENAVFLLIGLQASWIVGDMADSDLSAGTVIGSCLAVLLAVVVLRMMWVFPSRMVTAQRDEATSARPPLSYSVVVGWAGMRGVVTLAAAFAIPETAQHRELLVLIALFVTAATLTVQGLSLPWVVRRLGVPAPDPREDALARAELLQQASQAGLARLAEIEPADDDEQDAAVRAVLRDRLEQRDFAAWERLGPHQVEAQVETPSERYARLRLDMLRAERARVLEVRSQGRVPHTVLEEVLGALDIEESMIGKRVERRRHLVRQDGGMAPTPSLTAACAHLSEAPPVPEVQDRRCEDCVREGTSWVHLRSCLTCGHIGCCDSSPRRHASGHFHETGHPVMGSAEIGESWRWCFLDETLG